MIYINQLVWTFPYNTFLYFRPLIYEKFPQKLVISFTRNILTVPGFILHINSMMNEVSVIFLMALQFPWRFWLIFYVYFTSTNLVFVFLPSILYVFRIIWNIFLQWNWQHISWFGLTRQGFLSVQSLHHPYCVLVVYPSEVLSFIAEISVFYL